MVDLRRSFIVAAVGFVVVVVLSQLSYTTAQPHFSDWSAPVNLGPVINTTANETGPALSKNGLSLYFSSNRAGSVRHIGLPDIWVSQRNSEDEPWGRSNQRRPSSTRLLRMLCPACPAMGTGFS